MTRTILIVEDDQALRQALKDKLSREGYDVITAGNGEEGLKLALEKAPHLILLDLVMPVMDGMTMAKKLRQAEQQSGKLANNQIPIIILTNLTSDQKMTEAQTQGLYSYLTKTNWTLDGVVKKVKDTLNQN